MRPLIQNGPVRTYWVEEEPGKATIVSEQDCEAIVERNKRVANESPGKEWRYAGSIPNVILLRWINETGQTYDQLGREEMLRIIKRKLSDPDWRWLKVHGF